MTKIKEKKVDQDTVALLLCSVAQFAWLTLLSPTLATVAGGHDATYILAANFVFGGLGFLLSQMKRFSISVKWTTFLFGFSILLSMLVVKLKLESAQIDWLAFSGFQGLSFGPDPIPVGSGFHELFLGIGVASCSYSFLVGSVLRNSDRSAIRIYSIELIGAIAGILFAIALIECVSWGAVARLCVLSSIAALFFAVFCERVWTRRSTIRIAVVFVGISASGWILSPSLEPMVSLHISARDFARSANVTELTRSWNTYSKVQHLRVKRGSQTSDVISIGDGFGHASMPDPLALQRSPTIAIASALRPESVLLLFAGAGQEILEYRRHLPKIQSITAVELNPHVAEFAKEKVETGDARLFLESGDQKFDQIVFSWSGTTAIQLAGIVLQTTSYAYTREALQRAMERLNDNGALVFFGGPIYQVLNLIRGEDLGSAENSTILLRPDGWINRGYGWDPRILIFKKGTFSGEERASVKTVVNSLNWARYHWETIPDAQDSRVRSEIRTDDDPFVYDSRVSLKGLRDYFSSGREVLVTNALLTLLAAVLFFRREKGKTSAWRLTLPAFLMGVAFAATKAFGLYKSSLFLGNPTIALSIAFSASFAGQYLACFHLSSGRLMRIWPSFIAFSGHFSAFLWLIFALISIFYSKHIFSLEPWVCGTWIFIHVAFATYFASILFLSIVARSREERIVGIVFAADAVASGLLMILVPTLVSEFGILRVLQVALLSLLTVSVWNCHDVSKKNGFT